MHTIPLTTLQEVRQQHATDTAPPNTPPGVEKRTTEICINCGQRIADASQKYCGKRNCENVAAGMRN